MENGEGVSNADAFFILSLKDCLSLFPRLKENESSLSNNERVILLNMEKRLYENLSISEMEELLRGNT